MRKVPRLTLSVVFCVLVFIFAVLVFQMRRSTEAVKQATTVTFKNQITSIQISNIERSNRRIELIAKNIAALPVAVLNFDIEGDNNINVDFTASEDSNGRLDPGESEDLSLRLSSLTIPSEIKVSLKMAYFIDGSAEGDSELIYRQRYIFSAMDSVYQLASTEIDKISAFDPVALVDVKSKIQNLSEPANLNAGQQMGFNTGKNRAAHSIDILFREASMLSDEKKPERLAKLKSKFGKALPGVNKREK